MNHFHSTRFLLAAAAGALLLAYSSQADDEDDLAKLSAGAQKTIHEIIGSSKIEEVENTFADGQHATEVEFNRNGKEMAIVISNEGKLIQTEDRMSPEDAPKVIKQAVSKQFPNGKISHIKSVERKGQVVFEVSVSAAGQSHQLRFDQNGKSLKSGAKD